MIRDYKASKLLLLTIKKVEFEPRNDNIDKLFAHTCASGILSLSPETLSIFPRGVEETYFHRKSSSRWINFRPVIFAIVDISFSPSFMFPLYRSFWYPNVFLPSLSERSK